MAALSIITRCFTGSCCKYAVCACCMHSIVSTQTVAFQNSNVTIGSVGRVFLLFSSHKMPHTVSEGQYVDGEIGCRSCADNTPHVWI